MSDTWNSLNLLRTKSMQSTVEPFANQVSRLVLLSEGVENVKRNIPQDVCASANNVYRASQTLIRACKRYVEKEGVTKNVEYLRQCVPACEGLESAAKNFVHVCQELLTHADDSVTWRRLVSSGRSLLDATMKILSVIDMAEVAVLVQSVRFVQDRLKMVVQVQTMTALIPAFKSYSESLQSLVGQIEKRLRDLSERKQRDDILICMSLLKRSSSHLAEAMKISVKYSNKHSMASKHFISSELESIMVDLVCYLESRSAPSDVDRDDEGGQFMEHVKEILIGLNAENRLTTDRFELDTRIECVIRHAMAVAHLSQSDYRQNIVQCCKKILRTRNEASNSLKDLRKYPEISKLKPHFDSLNENLISEFHYLEEHVNMALTQQIVEVFSVTTEPLETMIQIALNNEEGGDNGLRAAMDAFTEHAEKVTQVAQFSASNHNHSKRNREIRLCCGQLDRLEAQLLPAIVGFRQSHNDAAATQRLKLLRQLYTQYFNSLLDALDQTLDTKLFVEISGQRIQSQAENVRQAVHVTDLDDIQLATKTLIGQARRVVDVSSRAMLNHTVPSHRNAVLADGVELRKVISVLRSNGAKLVQDLSSEKYKNRLLDDTEKLVTCIEQLMSQNANFAPSNTDGTTPVVNDMDEDTESVSEFEDAESERQSLIGVGLTSPLSKMESSIRNLTIEGRNLLNKTKDQSLVMTRNDVSLTCSHAAQSLVEKMIQRCLMLDAAGTEKVCGEASRMVDILTENMRSLLDVCNDTAVERRLQNSIDSMSNLTPSITSTAKEIASAGGDEIDRLHTQTRQWIGQVKTVETLLSSILGEVGGVAQGLVGTVGGKEPMKIKQCRLVQNWCQRLHVVVTSLCTETESVIPGPQVTSLQDMFAEVKTITQTLIAMATTADNGDLKQKLNLMSRQWSVKYVCCLWQVDRMTTTTTQPILPVLEESTNEKEECQEKDETRHRRERILRQIQKFTVKGTNTLRTLVKSLSVVGEEIDECHELLGVMNKLMTSLSTRPMVDDVVNGRYYDVVMVHWLVKFGSFCSLLEETVPDLCMPISRLIQLSLAVHTSSGDAELLKELQELTERLEGVVIKLMKACDVTDDVKGLRVSSTPGLLTEVKTTMFKNHPSIVDLRGKANKISQITKRLLKLINKISNCGYVCGLELRVLRVEWACLLTAVTTTAEEVNQVLAQDLVKELALLREAIQSKCLNSGLDPENALKTQLLLTARPPAVKRGVEEKDTSVAFEFQSVLGTPKQRPRLRPRLSPAPCSSYMSSSSRERGNQSLLNCTIEQESDSSAMSAAGRLDVEVSRWTEEENLMVQLARDLSKLTQRLVVRTGTTQVPRDIIDITRQVAGKSLRFHHFARVIADFAVDKKTSGDLLYYADHLPDIATRLSIISSVRVTERKPADVESDQILHKSGENLMRTVLHTLIAAQAATSQGIQVPSSRTLSQMEDLVLSTRWVRRSS